MGNCLVTKLKESVNNNNLSYLGKIRLGLEEKAIMKFSAKTHIQALNGGTFSITNLVQNVNEYDVKILDTSLILEGSAGTEILIDKHSISEIDMTKNASEFFSGVFYANDMANMSSLTKLIIRGGNSQIIGDVNNISSPVITELNLGNTNRVNEVGYNISSAPISLTKYFVKNSVGEITDANRLVNLTQLGIQDSDKVTGNIENLYLPSLNLLQIANLPNVKGDLYNFAENMRSRGFRGKITVSYTTSGGTTTTIGWQGQDLYTASGSYTPIITITENSSTIGEN